MYNHYQEMLKLSTWRRDAIAGMVTGLMAIPLSIGICLLSEYPIKIGLATVALACVVSFFVYLFKPGNHVGIPGIAAGLAPMLAMGVHQFGVENMPFIIFLTSFIQLFIWYFKLEGYILKAVPHFLIEGLLAGVGLKIAMKFLPYTYSLSRENELLGFWTWERIWIITYSAIAFVLFIVLYRKYKKSNPWLPYIVVIGTSILLSFYHEVPMLKVEHVPFVVALPTPHWE